MEYKYYTAICFDTQTEAEEFSQSCLSPVMEDEAATRYMYPVGLTETGKYAVVVYDLNQLTEADILHVTIEKVNTDFITLYE